MRLSQNRKVRSPTQREQIKDHKVLFPQVEQWLSAVNLAWFGKQFLNVNQFFLRTVYLRKQSKTFRKSVAWTTKQWWEQHDGPVLMNHAKGHLWPQACRRGHLFFSDSVGLVFIKRWNSLKGRVESFPGSAGTQARVIRQNPISSERKPTKGKKGWDMNNRTRCGETLQRLRFC